MKKLLLAIAIAVALVIPTEATHNGFRGEAVWYGQRGSIGACGWTLKWHYAAHRTLPCGTKLWVRHSGERVKVIIKDRGPFGSAEIDLARSAFRELAPLGTGRINVRTRILHDRWRP